MAQVQIYGSLSPMFDQDILKSKQREDASIIKIVTQLQNNSVPWVTRNFIISDEDLVYYIGVKGCSRRVVIPLSLQNRACKMAHDNLAHVGRDNVYPLQICLLAQHVPLCPYLYQKMS